MTGFKTVPIEFFHYILSIMDKTPQWLLLRLTYIYVYNNITKE